MVCTDIYKYIVALQQKQEFTIQKICYNNQICQINIKKELDCETSNKKFIGRAQRYFSKT